MRVILPFLIVTALLSACAPVERVRGNIVQPEVLDQVQPGVSSRSDVMRALGSPTTVAPFDDNTWYYIGQEMEKRGIFDPEVTGEKIVRVQFDQAGIVQSIGPLEVSRLDVPVSDSRTPTYGNELTALQQLLGNLGRFNPPQE